MKQQSTTNIGKTDSSHQESAASARLVQVKAPASHGLIQLQQLIGNHALGFYIQTKLKVSQPGDPFEQEADNVAEQVMRMPDPRAQNGAGEPSRLREQEDEPVAADLDVLVARKSEDSLSQTAPISGALDLDGRGEPLTRSVRDFFEPRFASDFSHVRIHTDAHAAEMAGAFNARAFTVGPHIAFGAGEYSPQTLTGQGLLAHELTHAVQQNGGRESTFGAAQPMPARTSPVRTRQAKSATVLQRSEPQIAREPIRVILISSGQDQYQPPGSKVIYRVGDAAGSHIIMDITHVGQDAIFKVFNFATAQAKELSLAEWQFLQMSAHIGGGNSGITRLGRQLSPAEWRSLWPNPMPEILRRYEAGQLALDDQAVLTGYEGMIRSEARLSLDRNEQTLDEMLGAPDRVKRIQEYADGLREASIVRDALINRRNSIAHSLVRQHSFTFLPKAGTGPNIVQQLNLTRQQQQVDDALRFWLASFPLLTRVRTQDINAVAVEAKLREIKSNIVQTRDLLNRAKLDPMDLDTVRAHLANRLGPRATKVVEAEDKSRSRWGIAKAIGLTAAAIALLFLPGGIFIDMAIGVAIAADAIDHAIEVGRAANTGLHVDDGLMSQSQANWAVFGAVLATVFAVIGVAAAGFRVLRVAQAVRGLGQAMPELGLANRVAVARAIADDPALVSTFARMTPGDAAISARVAAAVRQAGGDVRALRTALADVARIAAIPRRLPTGADIYEPLRQITDGSDIARIARETGLGRAEIEAAKRNLMLDEHILVDDVTGVLYRSRFEPIPEAAKVWGRAARGETITAAERDFLKRLVRHEHAEGGILSTQARTLDQAFLRGELEGNLRKVLESKGWNSTKIDHLLKSEPKPMTPYRYAHIVAHVSGAPNP